MLFASGMIFFQALAQTTTFQLPQQCRDRGITDPFQCEQYMASLNTNTTGTTNTTTTTNTLNTATSTDTTTSTTTIELPLPCKEKGITDPFQCEQYMASLNTTTSTTTIELPLPCKEKGITDPFQCEQYMASLSAGTSTTTNTNTSTFQLPQACKDKGITDPELCKRYLESLNTNTSTTTFQLPQACKDKGITDPELCKRYMESLVTGTTPQMPTQCAEKGITDPNECRSLIESLVKAQLSEEQKADPYVTVDYAKSFLPPLCLQEKITEPERCAAFMKEKFGAGVQGGTTGTTNAMLFLPKECIDQGISTPEDCQKLFEGRGILPECKNAGITSAEDCRSHMAKKFLPKECQDKGVTGEKECEQLLTNAFMPPTCKSQGVNDVFACKQLMLKKYGKPKGCEDVDEAECWRRIDAGKVDDSELKEKITQNELPERCRALGATDLDECEQKAGSQFVPDECRQAGIFSAEGCKRHLFEKYQVTETIRQAMPEECRQANIDDPQSCKEHMQSKFFPRACLEQKISDPEECKTFMTIRSVPDECRFAGIDERSACEEFLRNKHMLPACQAQGITDPTACEEFMFDRLASSVKCEGIEPEQCALALKERHLGRILDEGEKQERVDDVLHKAAGEEGVIDLEALLARADDTYGEFEGIAPVDISKARKFRLIGSNAGFAVTDEDDVKTAGGQLLTYDSDGDGLPDEMEKRHGTDPNNADTDGNGVDDKEELKKGKLKGIDKALVEGEDLGQPTIEGEVDEKYTVSLGSRGPRRTQREPLGVATGDVNGDGVAAGDVDGDRAAEEDSITDRTVTLTDEPQEEITDSTVTLLDGTGEPGEVVTIYIYSDLPMVVTTTVDANGQWSYEMEGGLTDGLHEVYVAVNDDTGKVIKKSNPLSFLVRGALAASAGDTYATEQSAAEQAALDATANVAEGAAFAKDWRKFMVAGGALIMAAILALVLVLRSMKKPKPPANP